MKFSFLEVFDCVSYVHIKSYAHNKIDAKSRKCLFIGYKYELFGYHFWDNQNRKIISRNVLFNEKVMYKDKSSTTADVAPHKFEFVSLDKLLEIIVQSEGVSDKESESGAPFPIAQPSDPKFSTPTVVVRRSSKTTRLPQWFSPTLNYILPIDCDEPQSYDEILRYENSSK